MRLAAAVLILLAPMVTSTRVVNQVALRDGGSVMQSFARTSADGTWIFAQVMQDGRSGHTHRYHLEHGDLTLTHITTSGRIMSWMYLRSFGHGVSISVQPAHPGLWIWIEAKSAQGPTDNPDGWGTRIARFKWRAGRTITPTSSGVQMFNPHPGTWRNSPSVSGDLIATRYMTGDLVTHYAVYRLTDFLARNYTPLRVIDHPAIGGTGQGWALMPGGEQIAWLSGDHRSTTNPDPGNTYLTVFGAAGVVSRTFITAGQTLSWREPEGVQPIAGQLCYGFASGPATGRKASVYCDN